MRVAASTQDRIPTMKRTQATSAPGRRAVARLVNADMVAKNNAELIMTTAADGPREDAFIECKPSLACGDGPSADCAATGRRAGARVAADPHPRRRAAPRHRWAARQDPRREAACDDGGA